MRFLAMAFVVAGCAGSTLAADVAAWRGRSADDLVRSVGPPHAEATLSDGGRVLEYRSQREYRAGGIAYPDVATHYDYRTGAYATTTYTARTPQYPVQLTCTARFVVDPHGVILSAAVHGNDC